MLTKAKTYFYILVVLSTMLLACNSNTLNLSKEEQQFLKTNNNSLAAIYIYYPPYEFINDNGEIDGILIDHFKLIENSIGYKFKKKVYTDWAKLIEDAKLGIIDVILEIQETKERSEYLTFTEPIFKGKHVIVSKKGQTYNSIDELKGKPVTVGKNFSVEEYIRTNYPEVILVPKLNEKECLKSMIHNEAVASIGLETINTYIIEQSGLKDLEITGTVDYIYNLSIGINKSKPLLGSIINKANNEISQKEKKAILDKWLFNITKPFYEKITFWCIILSVLAVILLFAFLVNYYLKRQVIIRTEKLNRAKKNAEQTNKLKTLFLQNISHEIRTPLNSILCFSNLLKNASNKNRSKEYLDTLLTESSKLSIILNNLVEVSELSTKKITPKLKPFEFNLLLDELKKDYDDKAEQKGLELIFINTLNPEQNIILSDKKRLNISIRKLIENAIKFTQKGSIKIEISTKNNILKIKVTDTGLGIQNSELRLIFDEFYQTEKELTKKFDGLGIGLSIANKNIRSLKGKISIGKTIGDGTCFVIGVPVEFVNINDLLEV